MGCINMAEFNVTINDTKTGKSYKKVVTDTSLVGKKVGETVSGSFAGLTGYEVKITGGSDNTGSPMHKSVSGTGKKKLLLKKGFGAQKIKRKGQIIRKTVASNNIGNRTKQINVAVVKYGTKAIQELLGTETKEEKPTEEKKEVPTEKPVEAPKEETKPEEKKE